MDLYSATASTACSLLATRPNKVSDETTFIASTDEFISTSKDTPRESCSASAVTTVRYRERRRGSRRYASASCLPAMP
jgi:hypothetical protein